MTRASFDLGARIVVLQASPMGESIYRKLGFQAVSTYGLWFQTNAPIDPAA